MTDDHYLSLKAGGRGDIKLERRRALFERCSEVAGELPCG